MQVVNIDDVFTVQLGKLGKKACFQSAHLFLKLTNECRTVIKNFHIALPSRS